jgi:sugar O-acyltransferase (sialic acid O-acetyltransferase NeuD family)
MAQNLVIIGAGNHAREVYGWASQAIAAGLDWRIKGFLDNRKDVLREFDYPEGIIDSVEDYPVQPDDRFLCAIGDPSARHHYAERIVKKGGTFGTLVHPTAVIGLNVKLGMGTIVGPLALIGADVTIGNHVSIGPYSACSHDNRVGDWCQFAGNCCLGGNVTVDEFCFFGIGAIVLPRVHIGRGAHIGPGALVLKSVRASAKMFGSPALQIGTTEIV